MEQRILEAKYHSLEAALRQKKKDEIKERLAEYNNTLVILRRVFKAIIQNAQNCPECNLPTDYRFIDLNDAKLVAWTLWEYRSSSANDIVGWAITLASDECLYIVKNPDPEPVKISMLPANKLSDISVITCDDLCFGSCSVLELYCEVFARQPNLKFKAEQNWLDHLEKLKKAKEEQKQRGGMNA